MNKMKSLLRTLSLNSEISFEPINIFNLPVCYHSTKKVPLRWLFNNLLKDVKLQVIKLNAYKNELVFFVYAIK